MYYANHLVELLACNINLKIKHDLTPFFLFFLLTTY